MIVLLYDIYCSDCALKHGCIVSTHLPPTQTCLPMTLISCACRELEEEKIEEGNVAN